MRWLAQSAVIAAIVLWSVAALRAEGPSPEDTAFFEQRIRPILVQRCEACHSAAKGKTHGGLALDSVEGWKAGGDNGPALIPGRADESLLIRAVEYKDDDLRMPPEEGGGRIPEGELALLREWIRRGAPDPRVATKPGRGGLSEKELREWWSFQPLRVVEPPSADGRPLGEIDRFLQARLDSAGLISAPLADRRTLARRVTYDLTGLPPTSEEVAAFVADESPDAFEQLTERLLASPRYGERWGRHWLDLVRYADTAGENSDHPVPDAWRYRNWVVDAFNHDLRYDDFIREQIAGDLIHAADDGAAYANGVIATGYLAMSRRFDHDSDKHMHLTFEDAIDNLGKVFLGLSIACARCHDHKYDPISANDYYALYGILGSSRFAFPGCEAKQQPRDLVPTMPPAEWARTVEPHERRLAELNAELAKIDGERAAQAAEFSKALGNSPRELARGDVAEGGSQPFPVDGEGIEVDVVPGRMIRLSIDPAGNYGADTTIVEWTVEEMGGGSRVWRLGDVIDEFAASNPRTDPSTKRPVWIYLDGRGTGTNLLAESVRAMSGQVGLDGWRTGDNPAVFVNANREPVSVWTKLPARTVFVHPAPDGPVAVGWISPVEGRVRMRGRVADGHPGGATGVGWKLEAFDGDGGPALESLAKRSAERAETAAKREAWMKQAPPREFAYAVVEGTTSDARIHLRGDPEKLGDVTPRRWLELFGGQPVPTGAGSGRLQLAGWLTDPRNPLVARVLVNRVWQHHFGRGLVATPNDFGTRGQRPSHPELLDYLANRFVASGWSVKTLHRWILNTDAYRRSSEVANPATLEAALSTDPDNTLLWRFERRRLAAEELRDTLWMLAGRLDTVPGGPHPVPPTSAWSFTQHVPFAGVPETDKRSLYQMVVRNRRAPFMALFDGADPNASTPERQVTTVPTQSLYFLNDPSFHARAEEIARRASTHPDVDHRITELFRIVLQREPAESERTAVQPFLADYAKLLEGASEAERSSAAWSAYVRVLLSGNEFLHVD
jgi:hypothetical protein